MSRRAVHGASVDGTIGNIIMLTVGVGVVDDIMKLSANRLVRIGEAHHLDEGRIAKRRYAVPVNCIERIGFAQYSTGTGASGMTNGTVQTQSGMTNGTVTGGAGKPGETTLTIGYKGGTAKVLVPVGTPIVRFEPTERTVLAKGQKLFVVEAPGATGAKFVAVGKDGVTPPM